VINSLDKLKGKSAVVTGASGYIGSALVDALVKHSCKVIRVSRDDMAPLPNTKTIKADVRTPNTWVEIVEHADIIYHLAGNTSVYDAAKNPDESLNSTLLPLNHLIKAVQKLRSKPRVVFASTATVYGLTPKCPVAETFVPKPVTVYDLHKLFAEKQLALATQQDVLEGVSLRLANVYGPSINMSLANDRGILNRVANMALEGKDLLVYGDGSYVRDYIYISDVVNAFLFAGVSPTLSGQSFNIASGIGTTVKQAFVLAANQASRITGRMVDVRCVSWPEGIAQIEFRTFTADIARYTGATGWKPLVNLEDGIAMLING
jgi:nucleoside-diphosphate-sugar epimerase